MPHGAAGGPGEGVAGGSKRGSVSLLLTHFFRLLCVLDRGSVARGVEGVPGAYMHRGLGSFGPPPPKQGKIYSVGGEKRETRKTKGKIRQKYENRG